VALSALSQVVENENLFHYNVKDDIAKQAAFSAGAEGAPALGAKVLRPAHSAGRRKQALSNRICA
jgi:hypothetical protein